MQKRIFFVLVFFTSTFSLWSVDFYSFESPYKIEETKIKIENLLKKIDNKYFKPIDETLGFHYGWVSRWLSPFDYKIYLTHYEKRQDLVIIRIEGNGGDALSLRTIFFKENLNKEELEGFQFYSLESKNHLFAQTLNLIHPALGILYTGYRSPSLTKSQMLWRSVGHFIVDTILIWAAGKNWFRNDWNPKKFSGNIIGSMIFVRSISAIQLFNRVRAHNRYLELGYSFPLDLY
ncbi:MAG: hypothetical protein NZ853_09150 [Leptospiraceae bacterium]|nr:hypothetical protein [Leptospiraceae bacterium]MDW7975595.1 hypothetical protein [Leptospiraceae bacterium]